MPQPTTPDPMDMFRQMFDGSTALRDRMKTQMEDLARAQQAMLSEVEEMSRSWLARRQDGAQAAMQAAQEIWTCGDVASAAQAYQRWLAGSVGRIAADTIDAQAHCARMTQAFATALHGVEAPATGTPSPTATPETASPATKAHHAGHREAA